MVKLNLGCGNKKRPGFVNIDVDPDCKPDRVLDLNNTPYPFKDNEVEEIFTEHFLEHVDDPVKTLQEIHRIMAPGGKLEVWVPHFSYGGTYDITHRSFWGVEAFSQHHTRQLFELKRVRLRWFRDGWRQRKMYYPFFFIEPIVNFLANLSPVFCDRFWCRAVGGFEEVRFELANRK